jgi:hypothetical protein
MGRLAAQVLADRAARDAARAAFDDHYGALKADVEERGIAGRIADEAIEQARDAFDEAVAIAETHPGAIGGTITALLLWVFRTSIIGWIEQALDPLLEKVKELGHVQDRSDEA